MRTVCAKILRYLSGVGNREEEMVELMLRVPLDILPLELPYTEHDAPDMPGMPADRDLLANGGRRNTAIGEVLDQDTAKTLDI